MFAKGKPTLVAFLALMVCSHAIATLTYTFPNTATDVYTSPGYSLGTLQAGFTLEVTLTIPGLTTAALSLNLLTIDIIDAQTRVAIGGDTTELTAGCTAGAVTCTRKWSVGVSKAYYLLAFDPAGAQTTHFQYFTVSAVTYNSTLTSYVGSPNNQQLLLLTEVARNSVVKLLYISKEQKDLKFNLYPIPESAPLSGLPDPAYTLSLFYIGNTLPSNNFLYTGVDLLLAATQTYSSSFFVNQYTITLSTVGYYALYVTVPVTVSSISFSWVTDNYLCPYNQQYSDFYGNFQGCTKQAPSEGGLPCSSFNSITGICSACIDKYILVNGTCIANTSCPYRQYYHFGQCLNVSPLCDSYDPFTGLCLSCLNPADYDLISGICVHKLVVCLPRQWQRNYICYNVDLGCGDFDPTTGKCLTCSGFQFELINGTCPPRMVVCPPGQYALNYTCVTIPAECVNFDTVKGICLACLQGYYVEGGVCRRIICPPGLVPSRFGIFCTNVSPLCEKYDDFTGRCLSCKSVNHRVNPNGECAQFTSPLAGCNERQRLGFGACLHPELNCYAYNLVTGNCDKCEKGYYLDYTGRCEKDAVCGRGQWSVNGQCLSFPENCLQINQIGLCSLCVNKNYRLENGQCIYFKTCIDHQYLNQLGQCADVSPDCATYNPTTGQCVTCKTPGTYPNNGVCCVPGQIYSGGACVDAVTLQQSYQNSAGPSCLLVHPSLGYCLKCNPGYEPDPLVPSICSPV